MVLVLKALSFVVLCAVTLVPAGTNGRSEVVFPGMLFRRKIFSLLVNYL